MARIYIERLCVDGLNIAERCWQSAEGGLQRARNIVQLLRSSSMVVDLMIQYIKVGAKMSTFLGKEVKVYQVEGSCLIS